MHLRLAAASLILLTGSSVATAAPKEEEKRVAVLSDLERCRAMEQSAERLACYDTSVSALLDKERKREVVVVDQGMIRQTHRTLFGLPLPRLAIFGEKDDSNEPTEIESTITRAELNQGGTWTLTLADGARWRQTDDNVVARKPRAGDKVIIRKGALSSFKMTIMGQPAVKVRRES